MHVYMHVQAHLVGQRARPKSSLLSIALFGRRCLHATPVPFIVLYITAWSKSPGGALHAQVSPPFGGKGLYANAFSHFGLETMPITCSRSSRGWGASSGSRRSIMKAGLTTARQGQYQISTGYSQQAIACHMHRVCSRPSTSICCAYACGCMQAHLMGVSMQGLGLLVAISKCPQVAVSGEACMQHLYTSLHFIAWIRFSG